MCGWGLFYHSGLMDHKYPVYHSLGLSAAQSPISGDTRVGVTARNPPWNQNLSRVRPRLGPPSPWSHFFSLISEECFDF